MHFKRRTRWLQSEGMSRYKRSQEREYILTTRGGCRDYKAQEGVGIGAQAHEVMAAQKGTFFAGREQKNFYKTHTLRVLGMSDLLA